MLLYLFFFFKHKTAYEMRISDWSSDVCSSDLSSSGPPWSVARNCSQAAAVGFSFVTTKLRVASSSSSIACLMATAARGEQFFNAARMSRMEEHTSELLSLIRMSYAFFCFKKKTVKLHMMNYLSYTSLIKHDNNHTSTYKMLSNTEQTTIQMTTF